MYLPGCDRNARKNDEKVEEYQKEWGVAGQEYDCKYDPHNVKRIIQKVALNDTIMLHMLLWPSVILVLAFIGILIIFLFFGCGLGTEYLRVCCCKRKVAVLN